MRLHDDVMRVMTIKVDKPRGRPFERGRSRPRTAATTAAVGVTATIAARAVTAMTARPGATARTVHPRREEQA